MQSEKLLQDFTKYCNENPEQRFFQALCNWSDYRFIYGFMGDEPIENATDKNGANYRLEDLFYRD